MVTSDATPKKGAVKYGITITAPPPFAKLLHHDAKSRTCETGQRPEHLCCPAFVKYGCRTRGPRKCQNRFRPYPKQGEIS